MTLEDLLNAHCEPIQTGTPPLGSDEVRAYLSLLDGWELIEDGGRIRKRFRFGGFSESVDFLVKLAPLANAEDHHPDVKLAMYRWMEIEYRTNSIGGLSRNDFIMAAKIDALYEESSRAS
jgi:4a-hydroxytetrahydrobiopterin dehydratase